MGGLGFPASLFEKVVGAARELIVAGARPSRSTGVAMSVAAVMGMRSRRAKNEVRVDVHMEVDRVIRPLEDRKFTGA